MKCLLIDFGASRVKSCVYNTENNSFRLNRSVSSPFIAKNTITKQDLKQFISDVVSGYKKIDRIYICTILGGFYDNEIYHSWKSNKVGKNYCLISGLFSEEKTFHIHEHHKKFTSLDNYESKTKILGYINNIPIYSSLGDTNCVIESLPLNEKNIAINIGTGSQIIYKRNSQYIIERYFPAGRMLLVYNELFSSVGVDILNILKKLTMDDVLDSTLNIDLNVFAQAKKYTNGGSISNINENNFTVNNLMGSVVKHMILQYKIYIDTTNSTEILLTGGMFKHIPCLKTCFKHYYATYEFVDEETNIESTFLGMVKFI